ncbi:MAG: hypothetical protein IT380_19530 [Myxococcales bacterium]|nr:hypothetical protein [Myxococcales bacterium]
MRATWLPLALISTAALAGNAKLAEAKKLADDLQLDKAAKALEAAKKVEGNDLAATQDILALEGIIAATQGKGAKARDAFRELLVLNPKYKLAADQPPRVRTPFYEAKEWAEDNALVTSASAVTRPGLVESVTVTVEKDVLKLARAVRFHLKVGGSERTADAPLGQGRAAVPVGAKAVAWWYELLGERGRALVAVNDTSPREEAADVAVAAVVPPPEPKPEPVEPLPEPPPEKPAPGVETSAKPGGWMKPVGWSLVGAGAVAAGVGVLFGVQANASRSAVANAETNSEGVITGLTQKEAAALEARAQSQATVANILFVAGGVLAAAGVVIVVVDGLGGGAKVTLAPAPGGLVAQGTF